MAFENITLSVLFRDPDLRRAFAKAERDTGFSFATNIPNKPDLSGGDCVKVRELEVA